MDKRLLNKGLVLGLPSLGNMTAHTDAMGGNDCGWGNMVFEGQCGLFPYLLATTTNGISGNAIFGMISGTNGCNINARPGYGDRLTSAANGMLDNIAEDMARGQGETLGTYAMLLGVEAKDQAHSTQVTQQHFGEIFASKDVTDEQVLSNTLAVMSRDGTLVHYAKQPAWDFKPRKEPATAGFFVCATYPSEVAVSIATADERLGHTAFSQGVSYGEGKAAPKCFRLAGCCRPWTFPADPRDIAPTATVQ